MICHAEAIVINSIKTKLWKKFTVIKKIKNLLENFQKYKWQERMEMWFSQWNTSRLLVLKIINIQKMYLIGWISKWFLCITLLWR